MINNPMNPNLVGGGEFAPLVGIFGKNSSAIRKSMSMKLCNFSQIPIVLLLRKFNRNTSTKEGDGDNPDRGAPLILTLSKT